LRGLSDAAALIGAKAMMLSELAASMFRFSPTSDAWKDFAIDCRERLNVASLTAVGESEAYDADGSRAIIH
jgi:hypothetical protein